MATRKIFNGLDLRGNLLKNVVLGQLTGTKPGSYGLTEDGKFAVVNAEGVVEVYTTEIQASAAIAAALSLKFDKAGGELSGVVSYAEGVTPTAAGDLVHKAYVDNAVDTAVQAASLQEGQFIDIADGEVSVDLIGLNEANGVSAEFSASSDGSVSFSYSIPNGSAMGTDARRVKWSVLDTSGETVEFKFGFSGTSITVSGSGADANQVFRLVGQA